VDVIKDMWRIPAIIIDRDFPSALPVVVSVRRRNRRTADPVAILKINVFVGTDIVICLNVGNIKIPRRSNRNTPIGRSRILARSGLCIGGKRKKKDYRQEEYKCFHDVFSLVRAETLRGVSKNCA
jgi:hypothetical protein